ncbi:hypothetical protein MD484_g4579, partial [Candolleomyces efflorescens]
MVDPSYFMTIEVTYFISMVGCRTDWLIVLKEAEAELRLWQLSNSSELEIYPNLRLHPYGEALSALHEYGGSQPRRTQCGAVSETRALAMRNRDSGRRSQEPPAMRKFEQQTWDLYELRGSLNSHGLLHECSRRAQLGDDDARRRLAVLDSFHQERLKNTDGRWALPPPQDRESLGQGSSATADPLETLQQTGGSRWALLIGNNDYPQSQLEGAVNDCEAWRSVLMKVFGLPSSHITLIRDADRATMVTALYDLRDNPEIKEGDHILFAFSGHGSSLRAKKYSFEDDIGLRAGSIEAICPVDRGLPPEKGTPDISDRELLLILSEVHNQTKAHVTVVLDCCHSGGGTRGFCNNDQRSDEGKPTQTRRSRSIAPLVDQKVIDRMFSEADSHPRRHPSTLSVRSSAWANDTADIYRPALLAACQETELAWEENMHGAFTSAILDVLRSERGRVLTCADLIEAISPISGSQRPMFDGEETQLFLR